MDDEGRFDALVGLIYDSAHSGLDPVSIVDAISTELSALGIQVAQDEAQQRRLLLEFLEQLAKAPPDNASVFDALRSDSALLELEDFAQGSTAEKLLRRLSPHLARSLAIRKQLEQLQTQQAIRETELAWLPFGMVWVDSALQVVSTNARAEELLRAGDGLTVEARFLRASVPADETRLEQALRSALHPGQRQSRLMALRRSGQTLPLVLSIIPAPDSPGLKNAAKGPLALVIIQMPGEAAINLEHLQAIYGFTATERKLAEALLNNETLESYAEAANVTRHTARTHLAHLFAKTGTSRQAELVRLLMLAHPRG